MQAGFSRYIRPGATFIDVNNSDMVAAVSADGHTLALVVRNGDTSASKGFTFDLTSLHRSGHDAGLLWFELECAAGEAADPRLTVSFWGDARGGPFEAASFTFTGAKGALIVPLDGSAYWLTLSSLKGIQIELRDPAKCPLPRFTHVRLAQRRF